VIIFLRLKNGDTKEKLKPSVSPRIFYVKIPIIIGFFNINKTSMLLQGCLSVCCHIQGNAPKGS
jgi:hypothetical protein